VYRASLSACVSPMVADVSAISGKLEKGRSKLVSASTVCEREREEEDTCHMERADRNWYRHVYINRGIWRNRSSPFQI